MSSDPAKVVIDVASVGRVYGQDQSRCKQYATLAHVNAA